MLIVVNGSVDRALGPLLFVGTRFLLSGQRLDHHVGVFKLRLGALIPRSVGLSVCRSVCLSVGLGSFGSMPELP